MDQAQILDVDGFRIEVENPRSDAVRQIFIEEQLHA
jgi:hypothetical protein